MIPSELESFVSADQPLAEHLWLGIGGPARYLARPQSDDEVRQASRWAAEQSIPVRVLGGGSNLLVRESGFDGLVIVLPDLVDSSDRDGQRIRFGGGTKLSEVVVHCVGQGLAGIEHLVGLPGTVAGGVVGNVSAGGRDIGSRVSSVTVMTADHDLATIDAAEIQFSHRSSSLGDRPILSVAFDLEQADAETLTKRMQKLWISRKRTKANREDRVVMPFVDPDGMSTSDLLRSVGLVGVREGNVMMHDGCPELLAATEGATSEDCLKLIDRVREQVRLQTGVELQLNLQIW